jgi:carbonic anhydrase
MDRRINRRTITAGLGLVALGAAAPWRVLADAPQNDISPDAALRRLMDGNDRFVAGKSMTRDPVAGRAATAKAQYPIAAILGCADSRAAPETVFDQGIGDLFVVRIAGNYLDTDNLASLEFAVAVLKVPLIVVLGHSSCGAVKAAVAEITDPQPLPGHIWDIADAVRPGIEAVVKAGGDLDRAIGANVDYNVARIAAAQPVLAEAVKAGRIKVAGGVYDLASGRVAMHGA